MEKGPRLIPIVRLVVLLWFEVFALVAIGEGCAPPIGSALPKDGNFIVSVGETGDVRGVEEAIVPPTPIRDVDEAILSGCVYFPVMEPGVGVIEPRATRARLCGEGMPMTNGVLLTVDPVLIFRCGDNSGKVALLGFVDPGRRIGEKGAGVPVFEPDGRCLYDTGESDVLREGARLGELRIASAKTSICSGVESPTVGSAGDSYSPYCGRGGRSGVSFHLGVSGSEDDRPRVPEGCLPSSQRMP
jgi:hypothetical protein